MCWEREVYDVKVVFIFFLTFFSFFFFCSYTLHNKQLTENWYGQGESDCLIKTKRCDGVRDLLTQRDFCPVL
jgi:hypothetical protein